MSRILLVDDDSFYRSTLRDLLDDEGFECHEAENGRSAFIFLSDNTVDLIITDWNMPVMNGLELVAQIEARWPLGAPPVILMTASFAELSHARAQSPEIFAVVSKLLSFELLLPIIEKALEPTATYEA